VHEAHRWRTHERGDEQVRRVGVHVGDAAHLGDPTAPHHGEAVGHRHRLHLVVGDEHRGDAEVALQPHDRRAHLHAQLRVEVGERLVEEEQTGPPDHRPPHRHTLALTAGQPAGSPIEHVVDMEQLGDLADPACDLVVPHARHLQREAEVLGHGHVRIERSALEGHREVTPLRRQVGHVVTVDDDLPRRRLLQAGDHPQQGGLAAPRRSDHHDELAVGHREVDPGDRELVGAGVPLRDGPQLQRRHAPRLLRDARRGNARSCTSRSEAEPPAHPVSDPG
jgi:hypothetical protein